MRARRRRVNWKRIWAFGAASLLFAVSGHAAEAETGKPAPAVAAVPSADTALPAGNDVPTLASLVDWRLAPVRWSGVLGTSLRLSGGTDRPRRFQDVETANIQGRSYIWQPWFLQVSAGLGLVSTLDRASAMDVGGGAATGTKNTSTTGTGNLGLLLFPVSRFPFQLSYDVTDSRASGELTTNDYQSRRLTLRQSYRPLVGNTNYVAGYDRSTLISSTFGADTVTALNAGVSHAWDAHNIDVNGSRTSNTRSNTGEGSLINRLNARHNYRPDSTLSVNTQASYSATDLNLLNTGFISDTRSRFLQLNSVGTWRPEEDSPLNVVASTRLFQNSFSNGVSDIDSRLLSGNIAANYRLTPQATLYGSFGLSHLAIDTESSLISNQAAGISYTPYAVDFGPYRYTWNAGGNFASQTGGADGTRYNLGGNIGHTLMRNFALRSETTLNLSASQFYALNQDSVTAVAQSITHSANAALRTSPTPDSNAYVSATVADSRSFGINESAFQIINLQVSGQVQLKRYSYASANLTIQGTRQSTPTTPADGFTFNTSGNLTYNHARAFDVPRLRYSLLYSANQMQFQSRLQGDVNAPREQVSQSLEQRLDYNVGRIDMRLSGRISRIEGRNDWLVFFSINRRFGEF